MKAYQMLTALRDIAITDAAISKATGIPQPTIWRIRTRKVVPKEDTVEIITAYYLKVMVRAPGVVILPVMGGEIL